MTNNIDFYFDFISPYTYIGHKRIQIEAKEIKGPKVGSPDKVLQGFIRAKNVNEKDLIEKNTDKGKFYFVKTQPQSILVEVLLIKIINRLELIPKKKYIFVESLTKIGNKI